MLPVVCPRCGGRMELDETQTLRFFTCPYCGGGLQPKTEGKAVFLQAEDRVAPAAREPAPSGANAEALEILARAEKQKDPKKRYKLYCDAQRIAPDSFEVNRALLYHGRLHEPYGRKGLDYSAFKCYLMNIFEHPGEYTATQMTEKLDELLEGEQLRRTLAASPDPDAFFAEYLRHLTDEYVTMFIHGRSANSVYFLGIRRTNDSAASQCAACVRTMLREVSICGRLNGAQREIIRQQLRSSFTKLFPGKDSLLDTDADA